MNTTSGPLSQESPRTRTPRSWRDPIQLADEQQPAPENQLAQHIHGSGRAPTAVRVSLLIQGKTAMGRHVPNGHLAAEFERVNRVE